MGNKLFTKPPTDCCGPEITEEEIRELTYIGFTDEEIKAFAHEGYTDKELKNLTYIGFTDKELTELGILDNKDNKNKNQ